MAYLGYSVTPFPGETTRGEVASDARRLQERGRLQERANYKRGKDYERALERGRLDFQYLSGTYVTRYVLLHETIDSISKNLCLLKD